jgi:hypothetical protein
MIPGANESPGLVNYLADKGQTATERAILLAQEILPAGKSCVVAHGTIRG